MNFQWKCGVEKHHEIWHKRSSNLKLKQIVKMCLYNKQRCWETTCNNRNNHSIIRGILNSIRWKNDTFENALTQTRLMRMGAVNLLGGTARLGVVRNTRECSQSIRKPWRPNHAAPHSTIVDREVRSWMDFNKCKFLTNLSEFGLIGKFISSKPSTGHWKITSIAANNVLPSSNSILRNKNLTHLQELAFKSDGE